MHRNAAFSVMLYYMYLLSMILLPQSFLPTSVLTHYFLQLIDCECSVLFHVEYYLFIVS